jgi:hypothetical protein
MAFPDPISIVPAVAGATSLTRTTDDAGSSVYRLTTTTELYQLTMRQMTMRNGRRRFQCEIIHKVFATATTNEMMTKSYAVQFEENNLDQEGLSALANWLNDSGRRDRLIQGEV